jgi:energy-coupling factor transporter ATP-binding protein EcfA2
VSETHEAELSGQVKVLRDELNTFLKARGISEENLSDVGKATERIAQLDEDIASMKAKVGALKVELTQFAVQREKAYQYHKAVEELLAPVNVELKGQGAEMKPIELQYKFNLKGFKDAMIEYVAGVIGPIEDRAPRLDYIESKLEKLDFCALADHETTIEQISDEDGVYATTLREFFAEEVNFEALKLEAEVRLLDVRKLGQIFVLYDGRPVENSSFGQRCTAVIVVLLLLGNTPLVIDEPEAHLDSSLIAKYLVELIKSRKLHRQIIFATHNANLVVNGDAELVHCMSMEDTKVTSVVKTTIENLAHRELLLTLEGGEKAFHQREKRYGIDG